MSAFKLTSRIIHAKQGGRKLIPVVTHWTWVLSLFLIVCPRTVPSFCYYHPLGVFHNPPLHQTVSLDGPDDVVSIAQLLSDPAQYHRQIVKVRGTVTQPELHIDESGLFIRFVFVLKDAENTLIVFGHHDRTQGNIQIETNEMVEVIGIFWKERTADNHQFRNNLEAITVMRYPLLHPNAA